MSMKLPCGHTDEEHEEMFEGLTPDDITKLMASAPTAVQALQLYKQAMEHNAEKNLHGLFQALFFLVNSYDSPEKPKRGWPPGTNSLEEARQAITAMALGAFMALDQQVRDNLSYPERWLVSFNGADLPQ